MIFRDVCLNAMKLLKNMGGGENSCSELVGQIRAFTQYEKPYDLKYVPGIDNVFLWCICAIQYALKNIIFNNSP
jgi:hypothetical protein